jgi:hypothetical protein
MKSTSKNILQHNIKHTLMHLTGFKTNSHGSCLRHNIINLTAPKAIMMIYKNVV